jgi:hypothetical protein
MPTPLADRIPSQYPLAFVWTCPSNHFGQTHIGETIDYIRNFSARHSIDKQFVQLESMLKVQFDRLSEFYTGIDFNTVKMKFGDSISSILEIYPDALSMELTHELSIFYTIKKNDYTFFLQHFVVTDEDDDEAIITIFKGNEKLPSYAGKLTNTISEMNSLLVLPSNTPAIESFKHELSF